MRRRDIQPDPLPEIEPKECEGCIYGGNCSKCFDREPLTEISFKYRVSQEPVAVLAIFALILALAGVLEARAAQEVTWESMRILFFGAGGCLLLIGAWFLFGPWLTRTFRNKKKPR